MDTTAIEVTSPTVDIERRINTVTYTYYSGARLEANRVRVKVACSFADPHNEAAEAARAFTARSEARLVASRDQQK